jgi:hypothetical protein
MHHFHGDDVSHSLLVQSNEIFTMVQYHIIGIHGYHTSPRCIYTRKEPTRDRREKSERNPLKYGIGDRENILLQRCSPRNARRIRKNLLPVAQSCRSFSGLGVLLSSASSCVYGSFSLKNTYVHQRVRYVPYDTQMPRTVPKSAVADVIAWKEKVSAKGIILGR